jgi:aspartate kinase
MKVFKFGGASVKNAAAIQNVAAIVKQFEASQLLIVVSAIGKTTNALERVVLLARNQQNFETVIQEIQDYHQQIIQELDINDPDFKQYHQRQVCRIKIAGYSNR